MSKKYSGIIAHENQIMKVIAELGYQELSSQFAWGAVMELKLHPNNFLELQELILCENQTALFEAIGTKGYYLCFNNHPGKISVVYQAINFDEESTILENGKLIIDSLHYYSNKKYTPEQIEKSAQELIKFLSNR